MGSNDTSVTFLQDSSFPQATSREAGIDEVDEDAFEEEEEEEMEKEKDIKPGKPRMESKRRRRGHTSLQASPSFKIDEDPQVVRHLVQTLGLIGTGDSLDLDTLGRQVFKLPTYNFAHK